MEGSYQDVLAEGILAGTRCRRELRKPDESLSPVEMDISFVRNI